jgi:hypothetical protein
MFDENFDDTGAGSRTRRESGYPFWGISTQSVQMRRIDFEPVEPHPSTLTTPFQSIERHLSAIDLRQREPAANNADGRADEKPQTRKAIGKIATVAAGCCSINRWRFMHHQFKCQTVDRLFPEWLVPPIMA